MTTSDASPEPLPDSALEAAREEEKIEEETLPGYIAEHYYPARIGEVLHARYRIICKLGYGVYSTVWLCKDTQYVSLYASTDSRIWKLTICRTGTYVAIKILVIRSLHSGPAQRKVAAYLHLDQFRADRPHSKSVRNVLDHFTITGPVSEHACLAHEPLGIKASDLQKRFPGQRYPSHILRMFARYMLSALAFLHEAGVVHAGKFVTLCGIIYFICY
jgi:serine/threonine-protein kinase SRPK3